MMINQKCRYFNRFKTEYAFYGNTIIYQAFSSSNCTFKLLVQPFVILIKSNNFISA